MLISFSALFLAPFLSFRKFPSYFDEVPALDLEHSIQFEDACSCSENDAGAPKECVNGIKTVFEHDQINLEKMNRIKMCDNTVKRDIKGSDDLTKEDYELLRKARMQIEHRKRSKRSLPAVSKENATRYCAERLAETPLGKLCEKLGTNVQALVNVCSADIQVDMNSLQGFLFLPQMIHGDCFKAICERFSKCSV